MVREKKIVQILVESERYESLINAIGKLREFAESQNRDHQVKMTVDVLCN